MTPTPRPPGDGEAEPSPSDPEHDRDRAADGAPHRDPAPGADGAGAGAGERSHTRSTSAATTATSGTGAARDPLLFLKGWTLADLVLLVVTVSLCSYVVWESTAVHGLGGQFGPGAGLFPAVVTGTGLVLMAVFVLQGPSRAEKPEWPGRTGLHRILATLVAVSLVPVVAPAIGLFTASLLLTAFVLLGVLRAKLLPSLLTLAIAGALAWVIFFTMLNSPMPRGPWGF